MYIAEIGVSKPEQEGWIAICDNPDQISLDDVLRDAYERYGPLPDHTVEHGPLEKTKDKGLG